MIVVLRRVLEVLSSLKLTILCLALAMVLVFVGTLAQVSSGIYDVQHRYFQSFIVWWHPTPGGPGIPVFPGGHLLGAVLLLNLIAAHARRFRWSWSKLGIHLTHAGLVVLLLGALFTDLFSVESFLRLAPGETKNYSEDSRHMELVVSTEFDNELDQVTAIPEARLRKEGVIAHESLPFRIRIRRFYQNSRFQPIGKAPPNSVPAATQGPGAGTVVYEVPRATAMNERDLQSAVIEILPPGDDGKSLGTWLVSDQLGAPQSISHAGKTWRFAMRPARYYKPFSLTLRKFQHDRYPGTGIPKNFASHAVLVDSERGENRDVLIYMNHPLRYRGETFYQSGFEKNETATILQVVYNPSFLAPYLACILVGAGLLYQFVFHFVGFLRRRKRLSSP
ncbi:MAG: cytochrome c biogenesis protein ResB [Chthoniobacterales bacterium]|nr:cytochrome c biogenesis protein ResB [Chthoniobacterales bacterium]